jgi:hypothetical protein
LEGEVLLKFEMAHRFFELEAGCSDDSNKECLSSQSFATEEDVEHASGALRTSGLTQEMETNQEVERNQTSQTSTAATQSMTSRGTRRFRLQARRIALTFPQCGMDKATAQARILTQWGEDIEYTVVASELHQDGTPHLHCAIKFKKRMSWSNANFADFIAEKHGNYKSMGNELGWLKYITKSDENPAIHGIDLKVTMWLVDLYFGGDVFANKSE